MANYVEEEMDVMSKLEVVRDVRNKVQQLDKLKVKMQKELEMVNNEEKKMQEFNSEIELLQEEKMTHVEALRLIHADINSLEVVMKQVEQECQKCKANIQRSHKEYEELQYTVNKLRSNLGLTGLPRLEEEDRNLFAGITKAQESSQPVRTEVKSHLSPVPPAVVDTTTAAQQVQPLQSEIRHEDQVPQQYKQQAPPMKICLSCQQQIHRNAPICPLCKAKSRSRHPKKKRKNDD